MNRTDGRYIRKRETCGESERERERESSYEDSSPPITSDLAAAAKSKTHTKK
jgi:hypothetical protein